MRTRPLPALACAAALAVLAVIGVLTFDDQTRASSAEVVTLHPTLTADADRMPDWLRPSDATTAETAAGLRLESRSEDVTATTRTVTLAGHRCYQLDVPLRDTAGASTLEVTAALLHPTLLAIEVPPGRKEWRGTGTFRTGGDARVALLVRQQAGASLTLGDVRLAPVADESCAAPAT